MFWKVNAMEREVKQLKGDRNCQRVEDVILNTVFVVVFIERITLQQRCEESKLASHVDIQEWKIQMEGIARAKTLGQNPAWHAHMQGTAKKPYDWSGVGE